MKLSLQTDFAVRILMYLATQAQRDKVERAKVGDVAEFFGISQAHVAKVVNRLGRLGLVRSTRGVGGGVEIARAPSAIAVGEVVEAFEGDMRLLDCVKAEDEMCAIQSFCKLRGVLGEAERRQMEYLRGVTIEDVLPTVRQLKME